jgi:hypothetical protein
MACSELQRNDAPVAGGARWANETLKWRKNNAGFRNASFLPQDT